MPFNYRIIRREKWSNRMSNINKLMGFYELKESGLPSVPWQKFSKEMALDSNLLWTVRTAVTHGSDFHLPRRVGVSAEEAYQFANEQSNILGEGGLVVVYPYFIAEKSGTIEVKPEAEVIEGVYRDLWNLVTENKKDITIVRDNKDVLIQGEKDFFDTWELEEINKYIEIIRRSFWSRLVVEQSILLEWSFAYNTDINKKKIGAKYLVFYEIREI